MRRIASALLVAMFAVPLPAHAAGCPQVSDPIGDAKGIASGADASVSDPAMDVERVDMMTDATGVKVVAILNQYTLFDTYSPGGRMVEFSFTAKGVTKTIKVVIDPTGGVTSTPAPVSKGGPAMESASRAVWVKVPLSALGLQGMRPSRLKKVGDKYGALTVKVWRYANGGVVPSSVAVDTASATTGWSYVHRAKACIA